MQQPDKMTALYCRLSQEDMQAGESMSIQNQKLILQRYADDHHFFNTQFFVDDGFSGVSFEREGLHSMLREVEAGRVATVITKDLSRLGRNYLKTGELIEIVFPENDVRYIAINDGVDTINGDNEFTPLRNWVNEFYARDTSKKIKAVKQAQAQRGERVNGEYPYGYIIDREASRALEGKQRELAKSSARLRELNTLFRKVYEDNALERITDQQFAMLTSGYEDEKKALTQRTAVLEKEINSATERKADVGRFLKIVRKYANIRELTYENVHEFIDRILIHDMDKEAGTRKIEIFYNFVGQINTGEKPIQSEAFSRQLSKPVKSIVI